jgi:predicted amino acid racemase
MKLVADCGKISENSRAIVELCRARGVKLACVTKCVCGEPAIARAILAGGVDGLAESRLFNIRRLREAGIDAHIILMRMPLPEEADEVVRLADCSFNSEPAAIRALSAAAQQQGTIHQVVVMVENGDRREGVMFDRVEPLCRLVLDLPGLQLAGLATSLNCLCGVMPSVENQQRFADLASQTETKLGVHFRFVSAGHTNNVRFVLEGTMPGRVNHLRVGEAILFGTDELSDLRLPVPCGDTFRAFAPVIELQDKPSAPDGVCGMDAFCRVHEWPDLGVRRRAILAMGEIDLAMEHLTPARPDITLVGASSDHTVIDVTEADPPVQLGDEIEFACRYTAVSTGWSSIYPERVILE